MLAINPGLSAPLSRGYDPIMNRLALDREEYIEQTYFFRVLRERMASNMATQEILAQMDEEILSTTRLPYAIQFLAAEIKHTGLLSSGFARLGHYFTPFQVFVIRQTEEEKRKFNIETALLVLEREAEYRSGPVNPPGLFIYQFEVISRNRLGYDDGLQAMEGEPLFDSSWRDYVGLVRRQLGVVDFPDLLYVRSELYVKDQRRANSTYEPPMPILFGEKEGKIAKAHRGREPLYLFAALQRQLGYPAVPRPKTPDDIANKILVLETKLRQMEGRLKLMEGELRGQLDLSQFMNKELPKDLE